MITTEQLESYEKEIKFLKSQYPPPETPLSLLQHFAECIAEIKRLREDESLRYLQKLGVSYSTVSPPQQQHDFHPRFFYTSTPNTSI